MTALYGGVQLLTKHRAAGSNPIQDSSRRLEERSVCGRLKNIKPTIRIDLVTLLQLLESTALDFGLTINRDKTKMMIVDRADNNQLDVQTIGGCEVVESYVYLGSTISNTGGCEDEIRKRCVVTRTSVEKLTKIWIWKTVE
ncbi:unnamed protein product [Euphydryas editha]|uniref:Reverse transcriptase n=1 Tax=Euphydryas editha TaxID=104508 RepID=A0AAU9UVU3_EUPED|nr:unnamed protein product [Euphydryas editha]